jgi:hypothetical protein
VILAVDKWGLLQHHETKEKTMSMRIVFDTIEDIEEWFWNLNPDERWAIRNAVRGMERRQECAERSRLAKFRERMGL